MSADITLYAAWTPVTCTVTFDSKGGSLTEKRRLVVLGAAIGTLPDSRRDGYSFEGWFTAAGSRISAATRVTADITLYAHWTPALRLVTFDPVNGTVSETYRYVSHGSLIGALPEPTRGGSYLFTGWFTAAGTRVTDATRVTGDVVLYAHWATPSTSCNVVFNPVNGTVSESLRRVTYGAAIGTLPVPTRGGYVFQGWFTAGGSLITAETRVTATVTLYAHWSAR